MTNPVKPIEEVGPASSPKSRQKPWWLRPYLIVIIAVLALVTVGSLLIFGHAADQNTPDSGPTTNQPGPVTTSVQAPPATPEPTSPAEQARAFYGAPGSFVSQHLAAYTNDGGDSLRGKLTDDNATIVRHWNYWWQVGCRNPAAWQQVLWGLVDVRSSFYQRWKAGADDAPQCAFPFEGGYGGSDAGTSPRIVGMKVSTQPQNGPQPYTFTFVADPDQPGVGVWLLGDSASQAPAPAATPAMVDQVGKFYRFPAVINFFSNEPNNGSAEMGKKTWTDAQIITSFNGWVNRACAAPADTREAMLWGVVDVSSPYWHSYATETDCGSLQFNVPQANGSGTSRMITTDLKAHPGHPRPYHFVYVTNPDNPVVGAWLLTDGD
jgi:hypothetical protein